MNKRGTAVCLVAAMAACSSDSAPKITPAMEQDIQSFCTRASECIATLSLDECTSDFRGQLVTAVDSCGAALSDFDSCIQGLPCVDIESENFSACQNQADAFDALCIEAPASCKSPCGGCPGSDACVFTLDAGLPTFACASKAGATGDAGSPCNPADPTGVGCDNGTICTSSLFVESCEFDHCCAPYCCVGGNDCGKDEICESIGGTEAGMCQSPLTIAECQTACLYVSECLGFENQEFGADKSECESGCLSATTTEAGDVFNCLNMTSCSETTAIAACEPP